MNNIVKIESGFVFNNRTFLFKKFDSEADNVQNVDYFILAPDQVHIGTDKGIIFFDTSVTIDGQTYNTIQDFITALYN